MAQASKPILIPHSALSVPVRIILQKRVPIVTAEHKALGLSLSPCRVFILPEAMQYQPKLPALI